jgi:UDP-N-acetylmuramoyl-L-alanyl-D-glutamate--2,6-diaminopimelate ligase
MIMQLKQVLKGLKGCIIKGNDDIEISCIADDSKAMKARSVFFAIKGSQYNGFNFIDQAIKNGAVCIVAERDFPEHSSTTRVIVRDIRKSCAVMAANFYNHPSDDIGIIGITGTNGKTTTLFLVKTILDYCGIKCATIGTIGYGIGSSLVPANNTTPSPIIIQRFLNNIKGEGVDRCVMEVSSHALHQSRVDGIIFDRAIFTNLTQDHLDYHKSMRRYFAAKAKLFDLVKSKGQVILNIDDAYGRTIAKRFKNRVLTYGIQNPADIRACNISKSIDGCCFNLDTPRYSFDIASRLIGEYNIYNILAAVALAYSLGLPPGLINESVRSFSPAPGRMEKVAVKKQGISVFVDYAHTHDALYNVLKTLRDLKHGRLIVVFGCGGDRDKGKRPKMGKVVASLSDYAIITSDNPRNEDPAKIIYDIKKGLPKDFNSYTIIADREKAIARASSIAKKGDIVLIAGKGHENYQIFKDHTIDFDDREIAMRFFA